MLHTKFHDNRLTGSREEDVWRFLPYMGIAAILVMWPGPREKNFRSSITWMRHMKFDFNRPRVSEEKMFENVDRLQTKDDDNRG